MTQPAMISLHRRMSKVVRIRREEIAPLLWGWLYIFSLLGAYYMIRPIRDTISTLTGAHSLPWLFSAVLVTMLLLQWPYNKLTQCLPRERFISYSYQFCAAILLLFAALFTLPGGLNNPWVGRLFFIWVSVFNLFAVSVFWALIVDVFDTRRGKRLFGLLAAAATVGAIAGSSITALLARHLSTSMLLILSVVLIQISVFSAVKLSRSGQRLKKPPSQGEKVRDTLQGKGALAPLFTGISQTMRSPYLLGICGYILFYSITSTLLYFQQASIVRQAFSDESQRTAFFASVDLTINVLTLICQLTASGRIISRFGTPYTLMLLPLVSIIGFAWLGWAPSLSVLVGFTILRRAINFALSRPSREILFTVVSKEEKYHAKVFIDTLVYRAGDQMGAWSYQAISLLGLALGPLTLFSVALACGWAALSFALGKNQEKISRHRA
ncbi:MFS transporter [Rouxiella badensis]|uniref:NTP/NDP exchange transporter n=1 Tax=Rouxiella badensis TaxID=1646377 RepID=UPI0013EF3F6E|nr:MFS transporter [Rouxiella badensis]QII37238.1 MFS transporter [Rouxiella badensis]